MIAVVFCLKNYLSTLIMKFVLFFFFFFLELHQLNRHRCFVMSKIVKNNKLKIKLYDNHEYQSALKYNAKHQGKLVSNDDSFRTDDTNIKINKYH